MNGPWTQGFMDAPWTQGSIDGPPENDLSRNFEIRSKTLTWKTYVPSTGAVKEPVSPSYAPWAASPSHP